MDFAASVESARCRRLCCAETVQDVRAFLEIRARAAIAESEKKKKKNKKKKEEKRKLVPSSTSMESGDQRSRGERLGRNNSAHIVLLAFWA